MHYILADLEVERILYDLKHHWLYCKSYIIYFAICVFLCRKYLDAKNSSRAVKKYIGYNYLLTFINNSYILVRLGTKYSQLIVTFL